jgi:hypothetical protein
MEGPFRNRISRFRANNTKVCKPLIRTDALVTPSLLVAEPKDCQCHPCSYCRRNTDRDSGRTVIRYEYGTTGLCDPGTLQFGVTVGQTGSLSRLSPG